MNDLFEGGTLELNSPITEEQWDILTDVDFDHTPSVMFHTKHGKDVEFVKVVRCKDCKHGEVDNPDFPFQYLCHEYGDQWNDENHFCSHGERRADDA